MPEVQKEKIASLVQHRRRFDLQGLGLLHHRLPQRLVQEGRQRRLEQQLVVLFLVIERFEEFEQEHVEVEELPQVERLVALPRE